METKFIKEFNTIYPNGYNLTSGGESKKEYSEESLKKMSKRAKERGSPSMETIEKIRRSQIGKKHSNESKEKRSKSLTGRIFSDEHKMKISKAHKGMKKPWVKGNFLGKGGPGCGGLNGERNGMYGKHQSKESKIKISLAVSKSLKGIKFTEEHKNNISKSKKNKSTFEKGIGHKQRFINIYGEEMGLLKYSEFVKKQSIVKKGKKRISWNKGIHCSIEHKNNISKSLKGKTHKLKILKCPYCLKEGKGGNMTRYHFNNCKNLKR